MVAASFFLVACGGAVDTRPEKERYISAVKEAICASFELSVTDDFEAAERELMDIFEKHGFDAEDEATMVELERKYEDDSDVQDAIMEAFNECATPEFFDAWGEVEFEDGFTVEEDFVIEGEGLEGLEIEEIEVVEEEEEVLE